jgi:hypothetical protein
VIEGTTLLQQTEAVSNDEARLGDLRSRARRRAQRGAPRCFCKEMRAGGQVLSGRTPCGSMAILIPFGPACRDIGRFMKHGFLFATENYDPFADGLDDQD